MGIQDRADPIADIKLPNGYMLWAIEAATETLGADGLQAVLEKAGLSHLTGAPLPNNMELGALTFGEFTNLGVAVLELHGRAGKGLVNRIGHYMAKKTLEEMPGFFELAGSALKVLPTNKQLAAALQQMKNGFVNIYEPAGIQLNLSFEEKDGKFAYSAVECPSCAGKQTDEPICHLWVGVIEEGAAWVTGGKKFNVRQVAARSMGAPACTWEIDVKPVG
jgi:predicted hydrocarbon binding protein